MWMAFQPIGGENHQRFGYEALMVAGSGLPHRRRPADAAERLERTALLGRAVRAQVASMSPPPGRAACVQQPPPARPVRRCRRFRPLTWLARRVVLEITERPRSRCRSPGDRVAELREMATARGDDPAAASTG
jgi:hypothetical protein